MKASYLPAGRSLGVTMRLVLCMLVLGLCTSVTLAQVPPQQHTTPSLTTPRRLSTAPTQPRAATVTVVGPVARPGSYPFRPGMRVRDLFVIAGGLRTGNQLVEGEIRRQSPTPGFTAPPLIFNAQGAVRGLSRDNLPLQANDLIILHEAPPGTQTRTPSEAAKAAEASVPQGQAAASLSDVERLLAGLLPKPGPPLTQFGYDLFRRGPQAFTPLTSVSISPGYGIGVGDELQITLWGGVQEIYQVPVDRDGAIVLPRLGVVQVAGFTLEQLRSFLRRRFAEFYPDFQMAVTLGKLRSILIYAVGEVRQPGAYTVSSLSTILNALFAAGGPGKNGTLRDIRLMRQGQTVHTLDLYDLLLRGDKSQDRVLQDGDTIFVPVIGPVAGVAGNVRRPAIYEITAGTPLRVVLEAAGGVTSSGYLQRIHLERFVANQRKIVVDLDLATTSPSAASSLWDTPLQDGDLVSVFPVTALLENVVELEGHVKRPGRYELKPNMRLRQLISGYDDLLPAAYLEYGEIVRHLQPDLQRIIVPFHLGALLTGETRQNLVLQPLDIVRVFAETDFIDPYQVRISGMVHKPGVYPLTQKMRVRDLLMRAGNVRNFAYMEQAELTRRRLDQIDELSARIEVDLAKALAGDPAHNLVLQDFDHLLIRQIPGIELRREEVTPGQLIGLERTATAPTQDAVGLPETALEGIMASEQPGASLPGGLSPQGAQALLPFFTQQAEQASREAPPLPVYPLVPGDERAAEALRRASSFVEHTVEIVGEVRFPGLYPIVKGERLSSVLRRAGGYTDKAYLRGAVFTRESVRQALRERLQLLLQKEEEDLISASATAATVALTAETSAAQLQALQARRQLLERLRTLRPEGRVVLQLRPMEAFADSEHDLELEPGDRLHIPQVLKYVNILGQVYNPASLLHEPGRDIGFYLEKVGGVKREANEKEIHVVQIDGTVISNSQDRFVSLEADGRITYLGDFFSVNPQPGDTIVVPRRFRTFASLRNARDIVQILFQSITTAAVILALL